MAAKSDRCDSVPIGGMKAGSKMLTTTGLLQEIYERKTDKTIQ